MREFLSRIFDPDYAEKIFDWFITSGLRILLILVGAYILLKVFNSVIGRIETAFSKRRGAYMSALERERRMKTLTGLLRHVIFITLFGIALMMVLKELGMDIAPIIAGAGILGLAVSFGAQNLVRDIISGFFIIVEDQIRIGDVAVINGKGGAVEEINLRTIVIRDIEGTVHIFPNGTITQMSNMSKGWSRYVVDVGVSYRENIDHVIDVLKKIGKDLSKDEYYGTYILEPLEVLGVDNFGPAEVIIKCMIKTHPLKQWEVGRELRKRIKNEFEEAGIRMPTPLPTVGYIGETPLDADAGKKKTGAGDNEVERRGIDS